MPQFVRKTAFATNSTTEEICDSTASMGSWFTGHGVMFLGVFSQDNRALIDDRQLTHQLIREEVTTPYSKTSIPAVYAAKHKSIKSTFRVRRKECPPEFSVFWS
jgi:hypothetical protein